MKFQELDDVRWSKIEPLLPPRAKEGKPRASDRAIITGILYVLITGCRWIDIPRKYEDDSTANRRLRNWEKLGVWKRIMDALTNEGYARWIVKVEELSIDSTTIAARKRGELIGYDGHHKKKGTKFHTCVTPSSLPVSIAIGRGSEHESRKLMPLMESIRGQTAPSERETKEEAGESSRRHELRYLPR